MKYAVRNQAGVYPGVVYDTCDQKFIDHHAQYGETLIPVEALTYVVDTPDARGRRATGHWEATLPPQREELHKARREARTAAETAGFVFNGHPFDSDRDSILRIANAATTALTASLASAPFAVEWHCADGYDMPMDAAGVMALQGALAAHGQACHDRSSALRALIEDPDADLDALAEEIKAGWPG